jgi:Holliday junction DNA helicase RuvA
MIAAVEGKITKREPTYVLIKTAGGLTYRISVSLYCSAALSSGEVAELLTTQIVREDANLLYGFLSIDEQRMFERLIKLSGVGAATALAVCSTLTPSEFAKALASSDATALIKVPGIGLKSAKRILVELGEFVLEGSLNSSSQSQSEAKMALEALGFKADKVKAALMGAQGATTEELIKEALKKLQ